MMRCLLCKSDSMEKSTTTYFAKLNGCYVIIENVPCMVCSQCGEVVYSASVLEKIDEMLDTLHSLAEKVFIMDYEKAA